MLRGSITDKLLMLKRSPYCSIPMDSSVHQGKSVGEMHIHQAVLKCHQVPNAIQCNESAK